MLSYNLQGMASKKCWLWQELSLKAYTHCLIFCACKSISSKEVGHNRLPYKVLWNTYFIIAPTIDGIKAQHNDCIDARKGGVCLAIQGKLRDHIIEQGMLPSQRAIWVKINDPCAGKIGVLGISAPIEAPNCTLLERGIFSKLDFTFKWFAIGDFNMIEHFDDQRKVNQTMINGEEKRAWRHLLCRLKVDDSFMHQTNHLCFSSDNKNFFGHILTMQFFSFRRPYTFKDWQILHTRWFP